MEKIYTSSKAILGIWKTNHNLFDKDFNHQLDQELDNVKNISIESDVEDLYPTEDHSIQSITTIIDKILGRGYPTIVNKFFEDRLINKVKKSGFEFEILEDLTKGRKVGYRIKKIPSSLSNADLIEKFSNLKLMKFSDQLTQHQIANGLNTDDEKLISSHEHNFFEMIGDKISQGFQSHFLRQPLLSDLIGKNLGPIIGSKTDFAINLGSRKIVIEIDGQEHETDLAIKDHDQIRDEALRDFGWEVWRIKNEEVENGSEDIIRKLKHVIDSSNLDFKNTITDTEALDSYEFLLILYPHLMHRTCKALNLISHYGQFPLKDESRILVLEEDIPTVVDSLYELTELSKRLCSLSNDFIRIPKMNIDYIGLDPIVDIPKNGNFSFKSVKKPVGEYDLIINHSFTLMSGQKGLLENQTDNLSSGNLIRLRSMPFVVEERRLLWSNPVEYDIGNFDSAIDPEEVNRPISDEKYQSLKFLLQSIFRKPDFWEGQVRSISRLLQKLNTIVLLPTGGGKSLIYQFAGLLHPGVTLIVDPLVALITDQVENMNEMGFDRAGFISSNLDAHQKKIEEKRIARGEYYYIFIAPERLQNEDFRSVLRTLITKYPISLAVIDEAHCVSEWGHDFRPSYLHLGLNIQKYCSNSEIDPPTLVGLTGTASYSVLSDIQTELNILNQDAVIEPKSFGRKELIFHVYTVESRDKKSQLKIIKDQMPRDFKKNPQTFFDLRGEKTNSGIVFCLHAGKHSSIGAPKVANILGHSNYYTGKLKPEEKVTVQNAFKQNDIQELVATKSFGMGIDKSNIVYTIHYTIPNSIEAFYQEAGRAGRNGIENSSHCYVIYSDDNRGLIDDVIFNENHKEAIERLESVGWEDRGDLFHHLWLLYNTYNDRAEEKKNVYKLWQDELYPEISNLPIGGINSVKISFGNSKKRNLIEKSIFRLVLLGIVTDYDVNHQYRNFNLRVKNVNPEEIKEALRSFYTKYKMKSFADNMVRNLKVETVPDTLYDAINSSIDFVYNEIVTKRKQALITMANICKDFKDHNHFSENILNYLQESEFTPILKEWINVPFSEIGIDSINNVIKSVENHEQSRKLIGTSRRMLDEDPENIALRLVSVIIRTRSDLKVESNEDIQSEIKAFITYCIRHHEKIDIELILMMVIGEIAHHGSRNELLENTVQEALIKWGSSKLVRSVLDGYSDQLNEELSFALTKVLLASTLKSIRNLNFLKSI